MENFQTSSNTSHLNALTADKTMSHVITHAHGAPRATHEHAKQFDFSRYLVIGPENLPAQVGSLTVEDVVCASVEEGFTCVQIRSKVLSARDLIALVQRVDSALVHRTLRDKVCLVINDRLDCVLAARDAGARVDGIHVGQSDIPPEVCRHYLGEHAVVGLSAPAADIVHYIAHVKTHSISYFGVAPYHVTPSKPDCATTSTGETIYISADDIQRLAQISTVPLIVGGGVQQADLECLKRSGATGFFVISAVCSAENPRLAARALCSTWNTLA